MKLDNKVYDALKWACLIFFPALSTAYSALAGIWGLPCAEQVPQTLNVVATFIGATLCVSSVNYNRMNGGGADG